MPYYPNGTLDKWMTTKQPSDDQKVFIFRQCIFLAFSR